MKAPNQNLTKAVEDGLCDAIKDIASSHIAMKPDPVIMVGDIHSDEKGTGARMSADKQDVGLIPVRQWVTIFRHAQKKAPNGVRWKHRGLINCVRSLADFQEGLLTGRELLAPVPHPWFDEAIEVFVYGTNKYKRWNWLKGMPWSVPLSSAIRHAKAVLIDGEQNDKESGLLHTGHFVCNLIMMATYYDSYPEGNDFPPKEYFK